MRRASGRWVSGNDFYNRETETALFIEYLREGTHIHLTAPRRIGKTSLMREVGRQLEEMDDYVCLYLNLESDTTPEDFVVALSKAAFGEQRFRDQVQQVFRNVLGEIGKRVDEVSVMDVAIKIRDGLLDSTWRAKATDLMRRLAQVDRPAVVFMDEVPILVNRMLRDAEGTIVPEGRVRADEFMSWLRQMAQQHQGALRFVVTGSIGFGPVLERVDLTATLNHMRAFRLEAWPPETAHGCLSALAEGHALIFEDGAVEQVTDCLGLCIPHHVQVFFDQVYEDARFRRVQNVTAADVQRVYRDRMLSVSSYTDFSTFPNRLEKVLEKSLVAFSLNLLTETATAGVLTPDAIQVYAEQHGLDGEMRKVRSVLDVLEHDGYLVRADTGFAFASTFLRDWWARYFGMGFKTVQQRQEDV